MAVVPASLRPCNPSKTGTHSAGLQCEGLLLERGPVTSSSAERRWHIQGQHMVQEPLATTLSAVANPQTSRKTFPVVSFHLPTSELRCSVGDTQFSLTSSLEAGKVWRQFECELPHQTEHWVRAIRAVQAAHSPAQTQKTAAERWRTMSFS